MLNLHEALKFLKSTALTGQAYIILYIFTSKNIADTFSVAADGCRKRFCNALPTLYLKPFFIFLTDFWKNEKLEFRI